MVLTDYELERKRRIEENKARMAQMGLTQTLNQIEVTVATEKALQRQSNSARRAARDRTTVPAASVPAAPRRRSGRVQGQPATFDGAILDVADPRSVRENYQEEVYSTDHVNALGTCNEVWALFVDGYDAQGNRIYDKVNGQTCHQCRQKTLGLRTSCSQCTSLQGVFCGDCLFMRYGENVNEANANPEWTCPNCRDLCNCSFHRSRRGWAPTGQLYPHASALGYASVAHYLVLNNLEPGAREAALPLMPEELAEETRAELAKEAAGGEAGNEAVPVMKEASASASGELKTGTDEERNIEAVKGTSGNGNGGSHGVSPGAGSKRKAEVNAAGTAGEIAARESSDGYDGQAKEARCDLEEKENVH